MANDKPRFSLRHYEVIASVMRQVHQDFITEPLEQRTWERVVAEFIRQLAKDNPRFDQVKFTDVCDPNSWRSRDRDSL